MWVLILMILLVVYLVVLALILQNTNQLLRTLSREEEIIERHEDIEKLNKLRDKGILTRQEHERILNSVRENFREEEFRKDEAVLSELLSKGLIEEGEYNDKLKLLDDMRDKYKEISPEEMKELQKRAGHIAVTCFAEKGPDHWLCVCGTENRLHVRNCIKCYKNREYILANCTRQEVLKELSRD